MLQRCAWGWRIADFPTGRKRSGALPRITCGAASGRYALRVVPQKRLVWGAAIAPHSVTRSVTRALPWDVRGAGYRSVASDARGRLRSRLARSHPRRSRTRADCAGCR